MESELEDFGERFPGNLSSGLKTRLEFVQVGYMFLANSRFESSVLLDSQRAYQLQFLCDSLKTLDLELSR